MGRAVLGEFEQVVLLSVLRLGDEAFGRRVFEELERLSVTPVTITAVYVTLSRMADKGLVAVSQRRPSEGGRAQKFVAVEPEGIAALKRSREQLDRFWEGVELDPSTRS